jgi:hypothetical protein
MIQCQSCGNENVQRLSVVYEGGMSEINAKESGMGVGLGSGGVGIGLGSSRIKGNNQSLLSKKAAPPDKKKTFKHFLIWGIGLFIVPAVFVSVFDWNSSLAQFLVVVSYLALAGLHLYSNFQYNRRIYPGLRARWDASFLCHKCGTMFQLPDPSPSGSGVFEPSA